ncbi:hypothetical protein KIL84_019148 [Mauremys mutica]|uniref:Uncharacterized protein n=1 Tax=Mauremys mutica TaxID=74926 RepID=A0A9D3XRS4_9SAUR|nr:hypothetical protein KIL84_019148 [Mauremys mutica]
MERRKSRRRDLSLGWSSYAANQDLFETPLKSGQSQQSSTAPLDLVTSPLTVVRGKEEKLAADKIKRPEEKPSSSNAAELMPRLTTSTLLCNPATSITNSSE